MKTFSAAVALFLSFAVSQVGAQAFSSGSTGADGALDLSVSSAALPCGSPGYCTVTLPESGVLNYTTINIPFGKNLIFKPNLRNTPVVMLAQGAVAINGGIYVYLPSFVVSP